MSVGSCQGNWTAPQGVIYSPDFPDEYGPDRNCSWVLAPPGAALELAFRLFELADSHDRLELRDATSGSLLRAFDGARPPPPGPLRLRAAVLRLIFRSDARGHAQGFALTFQGEAPLPAPPRPRLGSSAPPAGLTPLSSGLQDADADPAPLEGSTQTPAVPLDGANVSCSPGPGGPEASMGGETGVGGGSEFGGVRPFQAPCSPLSCARSPGLLDGDGRLGAATAGAVAAAPAARTVRALGRGLRAEPAGSLSLRPCAPGAWRALWDARVQDGKGAGRNSWVLEGRGLGSTEGVAREITGEARC